MIENDRENEKNFFRIKFNAEIRSVVTRMSEELAANGDANHAGANAIDPEQNSESISVVYSPEAAQIVEVDQWYLVTARLPVEWLKPLVSSQFVYLKLKAVRHVLGYSFYTAKLQFNALQKEVISKKEAASVTCEDYQRLHTLHIVFQAQDMARHVFGQWLQQVAPKLFQMALNWTTHKKSEIKNNLPSEPEPDDLEILQALFPSLLFKNFGDVEVAEPAKHSKERDKDVVHTTTATKTTTNLQSAESSSEVEQPIVAIQKKRKASGSRHPLNLK